jgi:hypothetical protein
VELLGMRTAITVMDTTYVTSICLKDHAPEALESEFGGNATKRTEQIASVDAVLHYSRVDSDPKVIVVSESGDPAPLNRAEWLEFVAILFNKEAKAAALYSATKARYNIIEAGPFETAPVVAWIEKDYTGVYTIVSTEYKTDIINEAGGTAFQPSGVKNFPNSTALYASLVAGKVDIVIDSTYFFPVATYALVAESYGWPAQDDMNAPKFIKNKQVWRHDKAVTGAADDWFESALPEPDAVLLDFAYIIHGDKALALLTADQMNFKPHWLRNVAVGEAQVPNTAVCENVQGPLLPRVGDDKLVQAIEVEFSSAPVLTVGFSVMPLLLAVALVAM